MDPSKLRRTSRGTYSCRWGGRCYYVQRRSEESPTRWLLVGTEGEFSRCRCIFKLGVGTIREAQEIVTGFYQVYIGDNPA